MPNDAWWAGLGLVATGWVLAASSASAGTADHSRVKLGMGSGMQVEARPRQSCPVKHWSFLPHG
jgi:hypothetical protein